MTTTDNSTRKTRQSKQREAIQFEKLSQGVYALNYKSNTHQLKYTKEQVQIILENGNEQKLREVSNYFFNVSGEYRRLVGHFTNMFLFHYLVIPKVKNDKTYDNSRFDQDFKKVLDYTDNTYVQETNRFITFSVILDGAFYGYEHQEGVLQQLPANYCRSKYKIDGNYAIEFNLKFFEQYRDIELKKSVFALFPDEFLNLYNAYKLGLTKEWVQLNPEFSRCHKLTNDACPLLSTIFPEIIDLKEYKELDKRKTKLDLYKLIVQKVPLDDKTHEPTLLLEEVQALQANAKKIISQEGIDVLSTPLETNAINLQEKGQTLRDNVERAANNVYSSAGTSKMLFNGGTDGGSIGLSTSLKSDEGLLFGLLDQFKIWHESKFKFLTNHNKSFYFEMFYPPITIYNQKDMFDMFKEAGTLGYSKLLPLVAMGIKQTTFVSLLKYEDLLKLDELMKPLRSSHTSSDGGRPPIDEGKLTPKGEITKSKETNKNN